MPLVKICGLSDLPALDAALEGGADLVGFVVFPLSPRHLPLDKAAALVAHARNRAQTVVLTVDADDTLFKAIVEVVAPDILQMHGRESPERLREVRRRFGRPVMKALGIADADDLTIARTYLGAADRLLLDAKAPAEATRPGGNGLRFDWEILRDAAIPIPWLLAGGLTPDTVADALRVTGARGVDVSSGVERSPGVKDVAKVRSFLAAAKASARVGSLGQSV